VRTHLLEELAQKLDEMGVQTTTNVVRSKLWFGNDLVYFQV
jgi:hypothetical protein